MRILGPALGLIFIGVLYAFGLWIVLQFYRALARIGAELADLKELLRQRLLSSEGPRRA